MYPRKGGLKNSSFQTEVPRKKKKHLINTSSEKNLSIFPVEKNQNSKLLMAFTFII